MRDTPVVILLGGSVYVIMLNECRDGTPWVSRHATKDGKACELWDVDKALAEQFGHDLLDDDEREEAMDRILFPALKAAKEGQ